MNGSSPLLGHRHRCGGGVAPAHETDEPVGTGVSAGAAMPGTGQEIETPIRATRLIGSTGGNTIPVLAEFPC